MSQSTKNIFYFLLRNKYYLYSEQGYKRQEASDTKRYTKNVERARKR